jgi:hypothetical protein
VKAFTACAALVVAALAPPGVALSQEVIVACEVKGHDLILYNRGAADLAAGTVIRWDAWNGKREGEHTLEEPLKPFVGLELTEALGASYFWDRPCAATVASASTAPEQNEDQRNGKIHLQGGEGNLPAPMSP